MEPILLPIGQVDGLIEYLKVNPVRIGQGFVPLRSKFRFNYYKPTSGGIGMHHQRTGRGSFSPLFPSDLHQIGDTAPLEYQIKAFKYGFYHSIIDQGLKLTRNDPMPFFLELFDRSPILQIFGGTFIKLKIQEEKTGVFNIHINNLQHILTFLINIILVVYSFDGYLVERDNHIIVQKFYSRQTSQFQTTEQQYDPVLYSIAVVQSDVFNTFDMTTDPSSASSLWNDASFKQEKEWVYKLWYFLIKMYDLKNLVYVMNAILFI